jgi:predicted outer membrane protein
MTRYLMRAMAGALVLAAAGTLRAAPEEDGAPAVSLILSTEVSGSDLAFFSGAARETALLGRLCEMARKHATAPEVQALAAAVEKEQTDWAAQLKELSGHKHVPLTGEPDREGMKLLLRLEKLTGVKFDKSCLDALGDAQEMLETSLKAGAGSADPEIRRLAEGEMGRLKQERERERRMGV